MRMFTIVGEMRGEMEGTHSTSAWWSCLLLRCFLPAIRALHSKAEVAEQGGLGGFSPPMIIEVGAELPCLKCF